MTYSHMAEATLPSAQNVFTSEFGMGSGGSRSLMPSGKKGIRKVLSSTFVAFEYVNALNRSINRQTAKLLEVIWSSLTGN